VSLVRARRLSCRELERGELRVELSAVECANALDLATVEGLTEAIAERPHRIVVLASAVPGVFCAGADLSISPAERARVSDALYALYELMVARPGPVVAVVEGSAVGGGAQLCAAADLRVAGAAARWRWAGPGHGLAVGAWILPSLVGRSWALELTMTSRWLSADAAVGCGFVTAIADDPEVELRRVLDRLHDADPAALGRIKQIASHAELVAGLRLERADNAASWDGAAPPPPTVTRQHKEH